jgi:precorrin-6B methylase 2
MVRISEDEAVEKARIIRPLTEIKVREVIAELARSVTKYSKIIEIGGLYGGTTAVIALAAPKCQVIVIDDFSWHPADDRPASKELLYENMAIVGVKNVTVKVGSSHVLGPKWSKPVELVFIDGGHDEEGAYQDLMDFALWCNVIAFHDYGNPNLPGMKRTIDKFLSVYKNWKLDKVVETLAVLRKNI